MDYAHQTRMTFVGRVATAAGISLVLTLLLLLVFQLDAPQPALGGTPSEAARHTESPFRPVSLR
jgi:hypothetical protein